MPEEILDQHIETPEAEVADISLDAMRQGKIQFNKLPKEEKVRLTREAREELEDEEAKEAWDMGWRSQEFFGGKGKDGSVREFIDHKAFLEKISQNAPVQNERLKTLREREAQKDREMEQLKLEVRKANELAKMNFERSLQNDEQSLDAQIKEAREYGDFERYDTLNAKKLELQSKTLRLKDYEIPKEPTLSPDVQAELEIWGSKNTWYEQDLEMQNYAKAQADIIIRAYPNLPLAQRLEKVTTLTKAFFPDRFPQEVTRATVLPGKNAGTFSSNKKSELTFSQLSDNEKQQARQMIRSGVFKNETDFMSGYNKIINNK
jgi:hypothetical protein